MLARQLAKTYMDILFNGGDIASLGEILAEDLQFQGPLFSFSSAKDYINSLLESPPESFHYELLYVFETNAAVCLIYQFSNPGISTVMSQTFEIRKGKIQKIILVFDTHAFNP